jgi:hypothetical protein
MSLPVNDDEQGTGPMSLPVNDDEQGPGPWVYL